MTVEGKKVFLHCDEEPMRTIARIARKFFANKGIQCRVTVLMASGELIEDSDDVDENTSNSLMPELEALERDVDALFA